MVQAILNNQKTETRRVITKPGLWQNDDMGGGAEITFENGYGENIELIDLCPYGKPCDLLYVRETWKYIDWTEDGQPWIRYKADNESMFIEDYPEEYAEKVLESREKLSRRENYKIDNRAADRRWRPSIHMPKWAARIWLEVVDIRVERLQEITESSAIAEGIERNCNASYLDCAACITDGECVSIRNNEWLHYQNDLDDFPVYNAEESFRSLWNSINEKRGYGWDTNPFVWVVKFKRVERV